MLRIKKVPVKYMADRQGILSGGGAEPLIAVGCMILAVCFLCGIGMLAGQITAWLMHVDFEEGSENPIPKIVALAVFIVPIASFLIICMVDSILYGLEKRGYVVRWIAPSFPIRFRIDEHFALRMIRREGPLKQRTEPVPPSGVEFVALFLALLFLLLIAAGVTGIASWIFVDTYGAPGSTPLVIGWLVFMIPVVIFLIISKLEEIGCFIEDKGYKIICEVPSIPIKFRRHRCVV